MCREIHFHGIQLPIKMIGHVFGHCVKGLRALKNWHQYCSICLPLKLSVDWYDFLLLMWQRDNRHALSWHLGILRTFCCWLNLMQFSFKWRLSFLYNFAFYKGYGVLSAVVDYTVTPKVFEYPYQGCLTLSGLKFIYVMMLTELGQPFVTYSWIL